MPEDEIDQMVQRLSDEVETLEMTTINKDVAVDEEYLERVARSQIETIAELVESMSEVIGEGEMISISSPSELEEE